MENKKVEIGKSRGNQIQGVKAVMEYSIYTGMSDMEVVLGNSFWFTNNCAC